MYLEYAYVCPLHIELLLPLINIAREGSQAYAFKLRLYIYAVYEPEIQ